MTTTKSKLISINAALAERAERLRALELSTAQLLMLARLAEAPRGENVPGGQAQSGRDASAWHRTLAVLVRLRLATRHFNGPGSGWALITPAGRALLADQAALKAQIRDLENEKHDLLQELPL